MTGIEITFVIVVTGFVVAGLGIIIQGIKADHNNNYGSSIGNTTRHMEDIIRDEKIAATRSRMAAVKADMDRQIQDIKNISN